MNPLRVIRDLIRDEVNKVMQTWHETSTWGAK